jgi:hypothetical protein
VSIRSRRLFAAFECVNDLGNGLVEVIGHGEESAVQAEDATRFVVSDESRGRNAADRDDDFGAFAAGPRLVELVR